MRRERRRDKEGENLEIKGEREREKGKELISHTGLSDADHGSLRQEDSTDGRARPDVGHWS